MYAQFRAQYPMGSLLSELLQIHEGKYIVRASIQVGGSTLATGMSAAHTIEQAEDQARSRALVVLGIENRPYPTQAHLIQPDEAQPKNTSARLSPSAQSTDFLPLNDTPFQRPLEAWTPNEQPELSFYSPEQPQLSWLNANPEPQVQQRFEPPARRELRPDNAPAQRPWTPRESPQADFSEPSPILSVPLDLSDIIAQTDVELKRLGWNQAQGRRYLEQAYDKRSRQHLTDSELIEFLEYLKAQPVQKKSNSSQR
jgi:hypothetical protein